MYEKGTAKVKLTGKDGNAFNLMGLCVTAMRKKGATPEQVTEFREEATSDDYNHLLCTCMDWCEVS